MSLHSFILCRFDAEIVSRMEEERQSLANCCTAYEGERSLGEDQVSGHYNRNRNDRQPGGGKAAVRTGSMSGQRLVMPLRGSA